MVEIKNVDKLVAKLDNLSNLQLEQALNKACLIVENEAKKLCPVDTGQLRSSITHEVVEKEGRVGTNVEYAPYVEYGTGLFAAKGDGRQERWNYQDGEGNWHSTIGQHPQPFLHPALNNNREQVLQTIKDEASKEIKDNAKR